MSKNEIALVDEVVGRARAAQQEYEAAADQTLYDNAALACAWALMQPERNQELSALAVATTGLGNVADKIQKNHRKTLGLLRDIRDVQTTGVLSSHNGVTEIARPIGVVGAVVPSTNPVATPTNNVVNALKCGNAIVLSPSPKGVEVCASLVSYMHAELRSIGVNPDLVQMLPAPSSKIKSQHMMETVDLIIVTGSQDNVRRAYSSGTPAIGVGSGNAPVIVDETADCESAASLISASKTFDNATSCSSESVLIVVEAVYQELMTAMHRQGARLLDAHNSSRFRAALFQDGKLNRHMIAKDINEFLAAGGLQVEAPEDARYVLVPSAITGANPVVQAPELGEKLSLALTLLTAQDYAHACRLARQVLLIQGAGHSVGLHTRDTSRALELGQTMPSSRIIVNQAHCFATGGAFNNGSPFSLSMGCGSWGGNSISENLNYKHFLNTTRIVKPVPAVEPDLPEIFAAYWKMVGYT